MSKKKFTPKLIEIPLPADVFDVEGASVSRSKRISHEKVVEIRKESTTKGVPWEKLAKLYPKWEGVLDVDTREPLPNPEDDPAVFRRLDYTEQVPWFIRAGLAYSPNQARKESPA